MSTSEGKVANAIGGKTARACDSCLRKRARWFCAADDAFLCQSCDSTVHSANQLASRHERVRLDSSSSKGSGKEVNSSFPAWHQGFTRKARTPRNAKPAKVQPVVNHTLPLVPEMNGDEPCFHEENDEQFLYRVPVFDPITDDFLMGDDQEACHRLDLDGLLNDDAELEVFSTDVGSLLGMGINDDSGLRSGALDCMYEEGEDGEVFRRKRVKVKEEDDGNDDDDDDDDEMQEVIACQFDPALDMDLNWDFNYASSVNTWEDDEEMKTIGCHKHSASAESGSGSQEDRKMLLRLNYESVLTAWATQGSPWTNGTRPQFDLEEFSVSCLGGGSHPYGAGGHSAADDARRQAIVSRYREKRRTRLFAKKIRYEVRKLNAEKRPRMKGRFVKRTSLSGSSSVPNYFKK